VLYSNSVNNNNNNSTSTNDIMTRNPNVARVQRGGSNRNPSSRRTSGDTAQGTAPTGEERCGESKDEEPTIETGDDEGEEGEVGTERGDNDGDDDERGLLDDTEDEDEVETLTSTEELLRLNEQVKQLQSQVYSLTARKVAYQSDAYETDVDDDDSIIDMKIDTGCFRHGPYRYFDDKLTDTQIQEKLESWLETSKGAMFGKCPWQSNHWQAKPNPEAAWREHYKAIVGVDKEAVNKNWECLMQACHIGEGSLLILARYLDIRSLRDITSPDDTTFTSYVSKMTKTKGLPITSIPCFKALRVWARWFTIIHSRQPEPQDFTALEAQWACKRYEMEHNLTAHLPTSPETPKVLKSFKADDWRLFRDSTITYVEQTRGVLNLPLSYLFRPEDKPTDDDIEAVADVDPSQDAYLMRMMVIDTKVSSIADDNRRLYSLLLPLLQNTDAWEGIRSKARTGDGRTMWITLIQRGDGDTAQNMRCWSAQETMSRLTLDDSNRGSAKAKFDHFIKLMQGAFNEMPALGEPVSEAQQVQTLIQRLANHKNMESYKSTIIGNPTLLTSFGATVAHLETCLTTAGVFGKTSTRNVSAVTTDSSGRIPKDVWDNMSKQDKNEFLKNRKKAGAKKGNGNKRKAPSYATATGSNMTAKEKKKMKQL
jgi:hypothetical protein